MSKEKYSLDDVPAYGSTMVLETFFLRRKGFTLAEVLITLAIIGVVAAMTIPTLVANKVFRGTKNEEIEIANIKNASSINLTSLGGSNCAFELDGVCFTAPFKPDAMSLAECQADVEKGDLGIKECYYDGDYWAGAVKACGGVDKMPTMAQVAKIADYVYNTSGIEAKQNVSNLTLDNDKVASLAFIKDSSGWFYVWSGEENRKNYAYFRYFNPAYTNYDYSYRNLSYLQAVCLAD